MQQLFLFAGLLILSTLSCKQKTTIKASSEKENLSEYGFFTGNIADLIPADGIIPYDLNTPLFSDYAYKSRFVKLPAGQSAKYEPKDVLDFPEGTTLIKTFFYYQNEQKPEEGKRIIETRLLIKKNNEWETLNYVWNEKQTDAILDITGDIIPVSWVDEKGDKRDINYVIPNKNQCKSCHNLNGKIVPIGPKVANLNKDFTYKDGKENQLTHWHNSGILKGYDLSVDHPKAAEWANEKASIHDRAMAYLDINCAHCHNSKGAANTSGLHLELGAAMDINLGIYKATVSAGGGTGGHTYSIVPGSSGTSIMVNRMKSINPGVMMPEVGRTVVHEEGVKLIAEWIDKMDPAKFKQVVAELK